MKKRDKSVKKAVHTLFISALFFPSAWLYGVCDEAWVGDNNGNVVVISTETQTQTSIFPPGDTTASGIAFTPDGTEVFLTDFAGVFVIDAATQTDIPTPGTPISTLPGVDVAISQDGEFAYIPYPIPSEGPLGGVLKVNTTTLAQTTLPTSVIVTYPIEPNGIAVTPDGSRLYIVGQASFAGVVQVVDSATGNTVFAEIAVAAGSAFKVAITPDGAFAYVTIQSDPIDMIPGGVYRINTSTFLVTQVTTGAFPAFSNPGWVVISPNGRFAYVTDAGNNSVYVIQISTNSVVDQILNPSFNGPQGIAITPDGSSLYVANFASTFPTSTVSIINTSSFAVTTVPTTNSNSAVIAMAPACIPASGPVSGRVCKNEDFWQTDIFSAISWSAPLNFIPTEYQIFRNGVLIDTVSSSQLSFKQHDLKKNKTYVYSIFAVNSMNVTLFIGSVSLKT